MEPLLRAFGLILKIATFFYVPLLTLYNGWRHPAHKPLPPPTDDLIELPAVELADRIRTRRVTARAAVEAYVKRIREVDPLLNAVVEERFEAALVDADRMDAMIATARPRQLQDKYPLCGVPFTVKESCGLKGEVEWCGAITSGVAVFESGARTASRVCDRSEFIAL